MIGLGCGRPRRSAGLRRRTRCGRQRTLEVFVELVDLVLVRALRLLLGAVLQLRVRRRVSAACAPRLAGLYAACARLPRHLVAAARRTPTLTRFMRVSWKRRSASVMVDVLPSAAAPLEPDAPASWRASCAASSRASSSPCSSPPSVSARRSFSLCADESDERDFFFFDFLLRALRPSASQARPRQAGRHSRRVVAALELERAAGLEGVRG